jgi:uncharacterized protein (TIGR03083 family)
MDTWELVDAERSVFADLSDSLTPEQWDTQSLCTEWKVRDVVAHVIQGATIGGTGESIKQLFKYGFRLNKLINEEAKKGGQAPTDELRANLRATIGSRVTQPGVKAPGILADEIVHQQDIRRPLGLARQLPPESARVALDELKRFSSGSTFGLLPVKKRVHGLRLTATDLDWEAGAADAPEVSGTAEALMMAMAGRPVVLPELSGAGVDQLRERITA